MKNANTAQHSDTGLDYCLGNGNHYTYMGLPLGGLPSHEGVGQAVLRAAFPVAGLVVAFKLTRAPAVVEGAAAATLLTELDVIIDHLIWICVNANTIR